MTYQFEMFIFYNRLEYAFNRRPYGRPFDVFIELSYELD